MNLITKNSFIIFLILSGMALLILSPAAASESFKVSFEKAQQFDKDGFYVDAIEHWENSIHGAPENIGLYAKLKLSGTYTKIGDLNKAAEVSQSLTETHPQNYQSWFSYANTLGALQKYSEAVYAFKKSISFKQEEGLGKFGLAFAYFGEGKPDLAINEFKEAMKIFKANKNISWYRDSRLAIKQVKGFERFPPSFANLWLEKNLKRVQDTFENSVLDFESILESK